VTSSDDPHSSPGSEFASSCSAQHSSQRDEAPEQATYGSKFTGAMPAAQAGREAVPGLPAVRRTPLARTLLILAPLAVVKLLAHFLTNGNYGYFGDEFYYLECADRLAWGYVDHPPLSLAILAVDKALQGTSIFALRLPAVLAGAGTVLWMGLLARALGGGYFAQVVAALAALIAGVYLATSSFFSINAFEPLLWAIAAHVLIRLIQTGSPKWWRWFGLVVGLGLLNKISMGFLALGVLVGLLCTPWRRHLKRRELWQGVLIAAVLFSPHLVWQAMNGWPTLEFARQASLYKIVVKSPLDFLLGVVITMHPVNLLIWGAGLIWTFATRVGRQYRLLGIAFLAVYLLLTFTNGKVYYLAPAFVLLFPLGAMAWERMATVASEARSRVWLRATLVGLLAVGGVGLSPMAIPVLSPEQYMRYEQTLGIAPPTEEHGAQGSLPQHFGYRFGWQEMTQMVARAYHALDPADQEHVTLFASSYSQAGALNFFGPELGLPRAISGHNNFYLWGPGSYTGEVALIYTHESREDDLRAYYEDVVLLDRFTHPYVPAYGNNCGVYLCRRPRLPFEEIWQRVKMFV
jgi:hypothetical protein